MTSLCENPALCRDSSRRCGGPQLTSHGDERLVKIITTGGGGEDGALYYTVDSSEAELYDHTERFNLSAVLYELGEMLETTEAWDEAAAVYKEAHKVYVSGGPIIDQERHFEHCILCAWGLAEKRAGRFREALRVYETSLKTRPSWEDASSSEALRTNIRTCKAAMARGDQGAEKGTAKQLLSIYSDVTAKEKITRQCATCGATEEKFDLSKPGVELNLSQGTPLTLRMGDAETGKTASLKSGVKLSRCSVCKSTWYCGRECQTADYKTHKVHCKANKAARAASREFSRG